MALPPPSNPQSQVNASIEQQQLNNFLGPVNGALGGLPVAEKNQSYFVVFTGAGGTGPEIIDQTALFITYLVDENGNVSKPSEDYDSLNNLIQNFEVGKNVVVRNDAPTALNGNIAGNHLITAVGRQQPILYTQTGSSEGANVITLDFVSEVNDVDIPRMEGNMVRGVFDSSNAGVWNLVNNYNAPGSDPEPTAANYDAFAGTYTVDSSGIGATQNLTFRVTAGFTNDAPIASPVALQIKRDTTVIATAQYTVPGDNYGTDAIGNTMSFGNLNTGADPLEIIQTSADFDVGDPEYTVWVYFTSVAVDATFIQFEVINQNPSPTPPVVTSFWENNSGTNLWLTASDDLSINYNSVPGPVQECLDFNFSPIETPFNVQVGDRIRFEYNPNTEYCVYEVIEPSSDNEGLLRLRLNTLIPNSVNLSNFVLHRVNSNDPAYVILDVTKNDLVGNTQNFNGVILPEYPTKRLKDNLDNILLDLKSRGIITDNEN